MAGGHHRVHRVQQLHRPAGETFLHAPADDWAEEMGGGCSNHGAGSGGVGLDGAMTGANGVAQMRRLAAKRTRELLLSRMGTVGDWRALGICAAVARVRK